VKGISPDAAERYSLRVMHGMKDFSIRSLSSPICAICPTLKVKSLFMHNPTTEHPVKEPHPAENRPESNGFQQEIPVVPGATAAFTRLLVSIGQPFTAG
jgi:hypothetical protein